MLLRSPVTTAKESTLNLYLVSCKTWSSGADLFDKLASVLQVPASDQETRPCVLRVLWQKPSRGKGGPHKRYTPIRFSCYRLICGNFRYNLYCFSVLPHYTGCLLRHCTVIHLKNKSDASDKFIEWVRKTENHFAGRGGYKVGAVRTDNGGEFVNDTLHEFFRDRGIEHQLSCTLY